MKHNQTSHALWILLLTILLNIHNVHASTTFCNIVSEIDTMSTPGSKLSSTNTLDVVDIPAVEQKKIQKISDSLFQNKLTKSADRKAAYILDELGQATHHKQLHVLDYLLSINFEHNEYLVFNSSLARIAAIPAARGDEDLVIIEKILNAKQAAFIRFGKVGELQHKIEMTEIANRIIAFSANNGHCNLIQRILTNTALICFDVSGINGALRNAMNVADSTKRNQIIYLLYSNTFVKPDLEGTIDAVEMALNFNNDEGLYAILTLDITHNHHTLSNILRKATLNMQAQIVHKLINRMDSGNTDPEPLIPDENSKILAMIKFYADSENTNDQMEKEKAGVIAKKIRAEVLNYTMPFINIACCELVKTVYEWHTQMNKTDSISEYCKYISNKDRFKENIFPILSLKIHGTNGLQLHPDVYQHLIELWNELLVKSAMFGDFQMGAGLLSEKYHIDFDQQTIQSAIDSINTCLQEYELPPAKKIKKEGEAQKTMVRSENNTFLGLLKLRKIK